MIQRAVLERRADPGPAIEAVEAREAHGGYSVWWIAPGHDRRTCLACRRLGRVMTARHGRLIPPRRCECGCGHVHKSRRLVA